MSGGGGSSTTTQKLDPTVAPFVKYALEQGKSQFQQRSQGLPQYQGQTIAGFTPDTQGYFGGVRDLTAGNQMVGMAGQAAQGAAGTVAGRPEFEGAQFNANRLSGNEIREYMNPYQQQAIDAAMAGIQRRQGEEAAQLRARQAASRALGGSRAAVESALQDREYRQLAAETEANMLSQGFDKASAIAIGQQEAARKAAQDTEQSRQFAEQAAIDRGKFGLTAADMLAQLGKTERDMEVQRLEGLKGIGAMQQAYEQAQMDEAYKRFIEQRDLAKSELADYAAIAYGAPAGQQTTTKQPSSLGSTIAGLGMYALGSPWFGSMLGYPPTQTMTGMLGHNKDGGIISIEKMMRERGRK